MEIPKLAVTTLEEAKAIQAEQEAEIENIINLLIKDSVYRVEMRDKIKMVDQATQVTYCPKALKKEVNLLLAEAGKTNATLEQEALLEIISDHKITITKLQELMKGQELKEHKLRQVIDVLEMSLLKGERWDETTRTNYIQVTPEQLGAIHQENRTIKNKMEDMQSMLKTIMEHRIIPVTIQPDFMGTERITEQIEKAGENIMDPNLQSLSKEQIDPS